MAATFRVTTYELKDDVSGFTGSTFTLGLRQDLEADYFVLFDQQGAFAGGTSYCGPDIGAARVSKDPHGTGDLGTTSGSDELELARGSSSETWVGTVTVVECLGDKDASGFRLRTVRIPTLAASATTGSETLAGGEEWSDIDQVVPFGGLEGGGAGSSLSSQGNWHTVAARFFPLLTGATQSIEIRRDLTAGNGGAEFCIYVVEWGSEWTVQRASPSGTNGGNGVNASGEYDTDTISSVTRDNAWVWGSATTADNGLGDGAHGSIFTLGNGVAQSATETTVALGSEFTDQKDGEFYVLEHSDAAVDYRFGTDNGTGIPTASASGTMSVDAAAGTETYGSDGSAIDYTEGQRFAIFSNTMGGAGNQYPAVLCSARHTASGTVTWDRLGSGLPGAAWLQSVDLDGIGYTVTLDVDPSASGSLAIAPTTPTVALAKSAAPASSATVVIASTVATIVAALAVSISSPATVGVAPTNPTVALGVSPSAAGSIQAEPTAPTVGLSLAVSPDAAGSFVSAATGPSVALAMAVSPANSAALAVAATEPTKLCSLNASPSAAAALAFAPTEPGKALALAVAPSGSASAAVAPTAPNIATGLIVSPSAAGALVSAATTPSVELARTVAPSAAAGIQSAPTTASTLHGRSVDSAAISTEPTTPAASLALTVSPGASAALSVAPSEPMVSEGLAAAPGAPGALAVAPSAPSVALAKAIAPSGSASVSISGTATTQARTISAAASGAAALATAPTEPGRSITRQVSPSASAGANAAPTVPTVARSLAVAPSAAAGLAIVPTEPSTNSGILAAPSGSGELAVVSTDPGVLRSLPVSPDAAGSVSISPTVPAVLAGLGFAPDSPGSLSIAPTEPSVALALSVSPTVATVQASATLPVVSLVFSLAPAGVQIAAPEPAVDRARLVAPGDTGQLSATPTEPSIARTMGAAPSAPVMVTLAAVEPSAIRGRLLQVSPASVQAEGATPSVGFLTPRRIYLSAGLVSVLPTDPVIGSFEVVAFTLRIDRQVSRALQIRTALPSTCKVNRTLERSLDIIREVEADQAINRTKQTQLKK